MDAYGKAMDPSSIHTAPASDDELIETEEIFAKPTSWLQPMQQAQGQLKKAEEF